MGMQRPLFLAICIIVACFAVPPNDGFSVGELERVIRNGIHRAFSGEKGFEGIPKSTLKEAEDTFVDQLTNRLVIRFRQLDSVMDGSYGIAKSFIEKAVKAAAMRTRWPKEQLQDFMKEMATVSEEEVTELYISVGLVPAANSPRISALDLENIIKDIIQTLLQDPSFILLLEWIVTLPSTLHHIFDELFANKTFQEIFDMLGNGNKESNIQTILNITEDVLLEDELEGTPKAVNPLVFRLAEAALIEAQPTVELIIQTYRQRLTDGIEELAGLMEEKQLQAPFIDQDIMDYIKTSAIHLMN